jgi:3-oxosteroid 1-dehydrogenase
VRRRRHGGRVDRRYLFKDVAPLLPLPDAWFANGSVVKAWTIESLAQKIGVPPAALRATTNRFNSLARAGRDLDFQRGDSVYDRYYADPTNASGAVMGHSYTGAGATLGPAMTFGYVAARDIASG